MDDRSCVALSSLSVSIAVGVSNNPSASWQQNTLFFTLFYVVSLNVHFIHFHSSRTVYYVTTNPSTPFLCLFLLCSLHGVFFPSFFFPSFIRLLFSSISLSSRLPSCLFLCVFAAPPSPPPSPFHGSSLFVSFTFFSSKHFSFLVFLVFFIFASASALTSGCQSKQAAHSLDFASKEASCNLDGTTLLLLIFASK